MWDYLPRAFAPIHISIVTDPNDGIHTGGYKIETGRIAAPRPVIVRTVAVMVRHTSWSTHPSWSSSTGQWPSQTGEYDCGHGGGPVKPDHDGE